MADEASKAGARNSESDRKIIAKIRDNAMAICDLTGQLDPAQPDKPMPAQMEGDAMMMAAKAGIEVELAETVLQWVTVKAGAEDWTLDVLGVPFGGPFAGKDRDKQYFDASTKIYQEFYKTIPAVYAHGADPNGKMAETPAIIGTAKYSHQAVDGHWYKVFLDKTSEYARRIWEAAKNNMARASSGSVAHMVRALKNGHILEWPVAEMTLVDLGTSNLQPANPYAVALPVVKAHYERANLIWNEQSEPGNGGSTQGTEFNKIVSVGIKGVLKMEQSDVEKLIADGIAAARKADAEAAKAKADADRVAALEAENVSLKAAAAKGNRLPTRAPHVTQFGFTRAYESLSAADAAFAAQVLFAAKAKGGNGPSDNLLRALGVKVAEDQSVAGVEGRRTMKAHGVEPSDFLDATKANELDYSTQANYGDEFVPSVWGSTIWEVVRAQPFVAGRLPSQAFEGPGDTFPIPLESTDPTVYLIGQATDLNATTGRPDATIGDSKVGTASKNMTLAKLGARVPFTGEMVEDSIIPWVGQVRTQTEKAFAEQFEHVLIDGDTATGATTNINHIGGMPTSTGTKRDAFLAFDGFRKLALVTNTANSLDAAGALTDGLFLQIVQLMGAAGLNAMDPTKVSFIMDLNLWYRASQLAAVKTQDVFGANATLINGLLTRIYNYEVIPGAFMHFKSTTNPRKANTAGKVDQTTQANNTKSACLAVRWDQWLLGYKRRGVIKLQDIPDSDAQQLIMTMRGGLVYRDNEASAIAYDI